MKKEISINGRIVEITIPKDMSSEDFPEKIETNHKTVNVGIRKYQKELISKIVKKGKSINSFVQDAVDDKLTTHFTESGKQ